MRSIRRDVFRAVRCALAIIKVVRGSRLMRPPRYDLSIKIVPTVARFARAREHGFRLSHTSVRARFAFIDTGRCKRATESARIGCVFHATDATIRDCTDITARSLPSDSVKRQLVAGQCPPAVGWPDKGLTWVVHRVIYGSRFFGRCLLTLEPWFARGSF